MKFTNRRIANTIIISTLLVASIASIGFSSWLIGNNEIKSDINVEVGDFIDNNNLLMLDTSKGVNNTGIECFQYCKDGFVNDGELDLNIGYLYFYLKLDINKIKEAYKNPSDITTYTSLFLTASLSFVPENSASTFNLINNSYMSTASNSTGSLIAIYTVDEGTMTNSLALENILLNGVFSSTINGFKYDYFNNNSYIYLTLRYKFSIDYLKVDFETSLFPNLNNGILKALFGVGGY